MLRPLLLGLGQGELGQGLVVPLEDRQHLAGFHEVSLRRRDPVDPGTGPGADDDEPRRRLEPRQGMNRAGGSRVSGSGLPATRTAACLADRLRWTPIAETRTSAAKSQGKARRAFRAIPFPDVPSPPRRIHELTPQAA